MPRSIRPPPISPMLQAPNMSLGVNVLFKIAGEVAKMLGDDYDKEIVEGPSSL